MRVERETQFTGASAEKFKKKNTEYSLEAANAQCLTRRLLSPPLSGYTNQFHINTQSEIAQRYNDISPLENHHCAITFAILAKKECGLISELSPLEQREVCSAPARMRVLIISFSVQFVSLERSNGMWHTGRWTVKMVIRVFFEIFCCIAQERMWLIHGQGVQGREAYYAVVRAFSRTKRSSLHSSSEQRGELSKETWSYVFSRIHTIHVRKTPSEGPRSFDSVLQLNSCIILNGIES